MNFKNCSDANHEHCYHIFSGVIHMVVPNGHILQECCHCGSTRTVHAAHAHEPAPVRRWNDHQLKSWIRAYHSNAKCAD